MFSWVAVCCFAAGQNSEPSDAPLLKGRQVEIACLAAFRFKQPQQALAYHYFRSVGAQYDARGQD
jgi:hypothetical protein